MPIIPKTFLHAVRLERDKIVNYNDYPFCIPAVRHLERLVFSPEVTFFIGENGSGKSTLLEAIATRYGYNAEGGNKNIKFATNDTHSDLHDYITLERGAAYPTDGFFLRAESFYNVATAIDRIGVERAYGGRSLHAQSHGEAFLSLLQHRFQGDGVYLLDEPEAALSPQRQLSVLTLIRRLVYHHSQLIIATHSPILLAYPMARIYQFSQTGISEIAYTDTEHYRITKDFLNHHERMLNLLISAEDAELESKRRK